MNLTSSRKHSFSIRWKLLTFCLLCVTIPTIILGVVNYQAYRREALANLEQALQLIASGWQTTGDVYFDQLNRIWRREQYLVEKRLSSIVLDARSMLELCADQPAKARNEDACAATLDKLSSIHIGRSGYIFIIDGKGDFLLSKDRIIDGKRVEEVGAKISSLNYKAIVEQMRELKGDDVRIVHYPWQDPEVAATRMKVAAVSYFSPRDLVVGASMFYTDFKSYELERTLQEEFKDRMARQRIGDKGYVGVYNVTGDVLVSRDRLRDGENFLEYRDSRGKPFVREILAKAQAAQDQVFIARYAWKELGEDGPRRKIMSVAYHRGWNWIITAVAYEDDFLKGLELIGQQIIAICVFFILFGGVLSYFLALLVSRPLRQLEAVAVSGDIHANMSPEITRSSDEIGSLARAFEEMMHTLRDKIDQLERSRKELLAKNEEVMRAQHKLVQSEKLAAIGQLAAGVAHEINNPLAYVMSNMETLEQYINRYEEAMLKYEQEASTGPGGSDPEFDRIREDVKSLIPELHDGLQRVRRIVLDLRTFSREDRVEQVEVDLEKVIEQVLTIVRNELRYKAEVVREFGGVPKVICHAQRMAQVFMNIIVNASHAVEPGKGIIRIRTLVSNDGIRVEIRDNGHGIQPEHLGKVFEPFFTTKTVGQGTGLGMSISYEIVRKAGGDILIDSTPGVGTTFTVVLPVPKIAPA